MSQNELGGGAEIDKLRTRLKAAVDAQSVPPGLEARIRLELQQRQSGRAPRFEWLRARWLAPLGAAAAAATFAIAFWPASLQPMPSLADRPAQGAYIEKVSERLAAVLKVGLADHIHCAIFRKYPAIPPAHEKLEASLGPSYQGLLSVVRAAVPPGYRIVMAHQCSYAGRKYVHLTLRNGDSVISLVLARKGPGESMRSLPGESHSGIAIHQASSDRYRIAAFETGDFLAYVISDLKRPENLKLAAALAPGVRDVLGRVS